MKKQHRILFITIILFLFTACGIKKSDEKVLTESSTDLKDIVESDTLRVATMYGSTSYFLFRDELLGFDYEMVRNLANYLRLNLEIKIARTEKEMTQWLEDGDVDIVAYNIIETKELKKKYYFVLPQPDSHQVLVQSMGANALADVTQLAGKTVYVKANSIYHERLKSLNEEIGGTINISLAADSLSTDDLIDMVADGTIAYTFAYHNMAMLHKNYNKTIDCHLEVGFNQQNGWLIRRTSHDLRKAIEKWTKLSDTEHLQTNLFHKYWEKSPFFALRKVKIPNGAISPYDHFFKKYAPLINWDWRLLASIAYHESHFDSQEVSWVGAAGVMQLMPRTAENFGLDKDTKFDAEKNIEASVQYIKSLNLAFRRVENNEERVKFILAAYNSGPAHILDAMSLAGKYGKNPHLWFNNVEYFLLKKSEPQFYNDPVVKYGYYRGRETVKYVQNTLETYKKYLNRK
ncbi:MAG: transglycosylase SLT domain-containing protein [Paludibacter sp.]